MIFPSFNLEISTLNVHGEHLIEDKHIPFCHLIQLKFDN